MRTETPGAQMKHYPYHHTSRRDIALQFGRQSYEKQSRRESLLKSASVSRTEVTLDHGHTSAR